MLVTAMMNATAQENSAGNGEAGKVFWKEDFSGGKMPEGWKNVDSSKNGCEWICTNQPYPGSYQYQQQAPPIASRSRGYYLQYQPGYIVDEDQPRWEKKGIYPDAYIQTAPINCSGKKSVVLRFEQTFRWNGKHTAAGAGLYAGISIDGLHWTDFNVMDNVPPATDMFSPLNEEINISKIAAGQPAVYIRFYWKGIYSWYWMIDDIELATAYDRDIGITRLVSHQETGNIFSKKDILTVSIKNTGSGDINTAFGVSCRVDGGKPVMVTVQADRQPLAPGAEREVHFPGIDLSGSAAHRLVFYTALTGDRRPENDTLREKIYAAETTIGKVTGFAPSNNEFTFTCGQSKVKVIFYKEDIFRIWGAPDGEFTNPAGNEIVVSDDRKISKVNWKNKGTYYELQTPACILRAYKAPLHFALYDKTNTRLVWEEEKGLSFGARTTQTLKRQPGEYFYGCGMQNGYFSHRGKKILIEKGGGWNDGGRANPAPFYMSTAGYGAFRNTFDAGVYDFKDTLTFSHNENRFDCFYFYGPSLKRILNDYTAVTGRPFLPPRWGLGMGDSNCYNRKGVRTPDVVHLIADEYIKYNMPRGWILPNDGYGCGYVGLDSTVKELAQRGFHTGLWTENGLAKIAREVGTDGTRLCKLDVAWVGPGYKFALDACRAAYDGIQDNSNARGFVWSVMGWAGTQRYSTVWSGDQGGNWEYIRFHIPTVIGSGLSAFNCATGDVDGIFGGSDSTYTRDLQWKCFIPVFMAMSGWAKQSRQPYVFGEPYTDINRKYLMLKMQLTPYMYTYCDVAHETGVPAVRAMVLEYPEDPVTRGVSTQYQFMCGQWLLVAPVYKSEDRRDSIYLPKGKWIDYWDGKTYAGGRWLNDYPAPLAKLPLFVKAGAILPMYPKMYYDGQRPADTLTLDIYPRGHTSFDLYEDDGATQAYDRGAFAKTLITVDEQSAGTGPTVITVHTARGEYKGKYEKRAYLLKVHTGKVAKGISLNGRKLERYASAAALNESPEGWYFDAAEKMGVIQVKTPYLSTGKDQKTEIRF